MRVQARWWRPARGQGRRGLPGAGGHCVVDAMGYLLEMTQHDAPRQRTGFDIRSDACSCSMPAGGRCSRKGMHLTSTCISAHPGNRRLGR